MKEAFEQKPTPPEERRDEYDTREEALVVAKKTGSLRCRFYYKDGEVLGSERLDSLDHKPVDWFDCREKADEYIDVESEADAIQDSKDQAWYVGFRDPKDPEFKGKMLSE